LAKRFQRRRFKNIVQSGCCIKIANLVPIRQHTWLPQAILVSDGLISNKIFFSETALPNESKLGRKHPWKVIYKECASFGSFGKAASEEKIF
jgi:hypothetical protein